MSTLSWPLVTSILHGSQHPAQQASDVFQPRQMSRGKWTRWSRLPNAMQAGELECLAITWAINQSRHHPIAGSEPSLSHHITDPSLQGVSYTDSAELNNTWLQTWQKKSQFQVILEHLEETHLIPAAWSWTTCVFAPLHDKEYDNVDLCHRFKYLNVSLRNELLTASDDDYEAVTKIPQGGANLRITQPERWIMYGSRTNTIIVMGDRIIVLKMILQIAETKEAAQWKKETYHEWILTRSPVFNLKKQRRKPFDQPRAPEQRGKQQGETRPRCQRGSSLAHGRQSTRAGCHYEALGPNWSNLWKEDKIGCYKMINRKYDPRPHFQYCEKWSGPRAKVDFSLARVELHLKL